jgi:hypothetical protein
MNPHHQVTRDKLEVLAACARAAHDALETLRIASAECMCSLDLRDSKKALSDLANTACPKLSNLDLYRLLDQSLAATAEMKPSAIAAKTSEPGSSGDNGNSLSGSRQTQMREHRLRIKRALRKEILAEFSRKGGLARSPAQKAAALRNIELRNAKRAARALPAPPSQAPVPAPQSEAASVDGGVMPSLPPSGEISKDVGPSV